MSNRSHFFTASLPLGALFWTAAVLAGEPARLAGLPIAAPAPIDKPADAEPQLGWIRLDSSVRAEVTIDGRALTSDPAMPVLAPLDKLSNLHLGHRYVITLRRAGYADATVPIEMSAELNGKTVRVEMTPLAETGPVEGLEAKSCPAGDPGYLTLDSVPPSWVQVNGQVIGQTPLARLKLPAGCHDITFIYDEKSHKTVRVIVEPNRLGRYRVQR